MRRKKEKTDPDRKESGIRPAVRPDSARPREQADPLSMHFRNMRPDEELVHYARKLCGGFGELLPTDGVQWSVRIERPSEDARPDAQYHVAVMVKFRDGRCRSAGQDLDAFLALRNAFAMLEGRLRRSRDETPRGTG